MKLVGRSFPPHAFGRLIVACLTCFAAPLCDACDYCLLGQGISPLQTQNGAGLRIAQRYTLLDSVYAGTDEVSNPGVKEKYWATDVAGFYSVNDRLLVLVNAPIRKTDGDGELTEGPSGEPEREDSTGGASGLGDVSLLARYRLFGRHALDQLDARRGRDRREAADRQHQPAQRPGRIPRLSPATRHRLDRRTARPVGGSRDRPVFDVGQRSDRADRRRRNRGPESSIRQLGELGRDGEISRSAPRSPGRRPMPGSFRSDSTAKPGTTNTSAVIVSRTRAATPFTSRRDCSSYWPRGGYSRRRISTPSITI